MPDTIGRASLWGLSHYLYGEAYFGSCRGMRYRVAREPLENVSREGMDKAAEGMLMASVWPEPYAYAKTDRSLIRDERFPFSEEGMDALCAWLNERATDFNGDA
ncbi:MAG: hypothetical protein IJQ21_09040 [Lachnospiraceae bacterium]|nr:hypothetical protein [Lachnospiraceae bacterium]